MTLDNYKKKKSVQEFKSALEAAKARLAAEEVSLRLEKDRLDREREQLVNCVIKSPAAGMVIFPSAAEWKDTPDIEEGAVVREQQTLLMIPDLTKMQVKVGIHESKVDRVQIGMVATVRLQNEVIPGAVDSIAEVTRPAGWWTGNMVKYDTIIKLPPRPGLKPGMSVVVDVVLAQHIDALKIPVAAIVQSNDEYLCWVKSPSGIRRRPIQLGDSNDEFTVVATGLKRGNEVVLNPMAYVDEAQQIAARPVGPKSEQLSDPEAAETESTSDAEPATQS